MMFEPPKTNFDKESVPSLDLKLISPIAENTSHYEQLFKELFQQWVQRSPLQRDETTVGRLLRAAVERSMTEKNYIAVMADNKEYFTQNIETTNDFDGVYWLQVACAFGAENIGNHLIKNLNVNLGDNSEASQDLIAFIAASGNMNWLESILRQAHFETMPGAAYRYTPAIKARDLDEISSSLSSESTSDSLDNQMK